eukprot:7154747-Pyramimonas_sp.AAC.1
MRHAQCIRRGTSHALCISHALGAQVTNYLTVSRFNIVATQFSIVADVLSVIDASDARESNQPSAGRRIGDPSETELFDGRVLHGSAGLNRRDYITYAQRPPP